MLTHLFQTKLKAKLFIIMIWTMDINIQKSLSLCLTLTFLVCIFDRKLIYNIGVKIELEHNLWILTRSSEGLIPKYTDNINRK